MTFFGLTVEYPRGATTVEVWNRGTGTLLATRVVDLGVPDVRLDDPIRTDESLVALRWSARDEEESELNYAVMISRDGDAWWPAAYGLTEDRFDVDTTALGSGEYLVKVLALNQIRVGTSNHATFRV